MSLEANLGWGWGLLVDPILFFVPLSRRSPDMTEILLTGTSSLTQSINLRYTCTRKFDILLCTVSLKKLEDSKYRE